MPTGFVEGWLAFLTLFSRGSPSSLELSFLPTPQHLVQKPPPSSACCVETMWLEDLYILDKGSP